MRRILVGRNATLWATLSRRPEVVARFDHALSHSEVGGFDFGDDDEVWVLSYSRDHRQNVALLDAIGRNGRPRVLYFSSATTNIVPVTACYSYPTAKARAAAYAAETLDARVVLLGFVFSDPRELPGGTTAAIGMNALAAFFASGPGKDEKSIGLFSMVTRPFASRFEEACHGLYTRVQVALGSYPCMLRPVDALLRALGWKWYGYIALSNRLWLTTT